MGFRPDQLLFRMSLVVVALTIQHLVKNGPGVLPMPCLNKVATIGSNMTSSAPAALEGAYAPNTALRSGRRILQGEVDGSETVAVLETGEMILLDKFGYVKRAALQDNGEWEITGPSVYLGAGRPLGGHVLPSRELIVCDSVKLNGFVHFAGGLVASVLQGLIKVDLSSGLVTVLASSVSLDSPIAPGARIGYANDLDIAADGTVYFSDSSEITPALNREGYWDTMRAFVLTGLQGSPTGRLLRYDPTTGKTHCLAEGIWYANGVALAKDESFVLVAETWTLRVLRHWLTGPKVGVTELFLDNVPGYPDGVSRSEDGNFWVAVPCPVLTLIQKALPNMWLRWVLSWVSEVYKPKPQVLGMVIKVDPEGRPLYSLQDPEGQVVPMVTSVTEHGGKLYFGNLAYPFVAELDMSAVEGKACEVS